MKMKLLNGGKFQRTLIIEALEGKVVLVMINLLK